MIPRENLDQIAEILAEIKKLNETLLLILEKLPEQKPKKDKKNE